MISSCKVFVFFSNWKRLSIVERLLCFSVEYYYIPFQEFCSVFLSYWTHFHSFYYYGSHKNIWSSRLGCESEAFASDSQPSLEDWFQFFSIICLFVLIFIVLSLIDVEWVRSLSIHCLLTIEMIIDGIYIALCLSKQLTSLFFIHNIYNRKFICKNAKLHISKINIENWDWIWMHSICFVLCCSSQKMRHIFLPLSHEFS